MTGTAAWVTAGGLENERGRLRRAALRALEAPTVGDVHPWRLRIVGTTLRVEADLDHWNPYRDEDRHGLLLSIGAAVTNARTGLAAAGIGHQVRLLVPPGPSSGYAEVVLDETVAPDGDRARLAPYTSALPEALDGGTGLAGLDRGPSVGADLRAAARAEGCDLVPIGPDTPMPTGTFPVDGHLFVLVTRTDGPLERLHAGAGLQRVRLTAAAAGGGSSAVEAATASPLARATLRAQLGVTSYPQMMIRVGAPGPIKRPQRRRLAEVLSEQPNYAETRLTVVR